MVKLAVEANTPAVFLQATRQPCSWMSGLVRGLVTESIRSRLLLSIAWLSLAPLWQVAAEAHITTAETEIAGLLKLVEQFAATRIYMPAPK